MLRTRLFFLSLCLLATVVAVASWRYVAPLAPGVRALGPQQSTAGQCDVLVVGGTPSGVAAALAAARRGARVVLVEERAHLGGDVVYAMLNMFDVPMLPGQASPVVHGIFAEFFEQLGVGFDIDHARRLFEDTIAAEPNIHTYYRTRVTRIIKQGDRVTGVTLFTAWGNAPRPAVRKKAGKKANKTAHSTLIAATATPALQASPTVAPTPLPRKEGEEKTFEVNAVIDATNDASFAARAGAGYYVGRENANPDKRMQSAGLLFSVAGVNWNQVTNYVLSTRLIKAAHPLPQQAASDANPSLTRGAKVAAHRTPEKRILVQLGGVHGNYAWERGEIVRDYKPHGPDVICLSVNFGKQSDGTVVLNTINIVNTDGLSETSKQHAYREAVKELPYFLPYLRRTMPGFKHARLARIAPELYIRETRHIHGHYSLKVEDVRAQKRFFDRIALVSYPLDLHPYVKGQFNPFGPQRFIYTLPLRCLVPRKVNGLFVASRSLSATYSAAGSARVIPVTMSAGEAAGAAAYMCSRLGITPYDMMKDSRYVGQLQDDLRAEGLNIGDKPFGPAPTPEAVLTPIAATPTPSLTPTALPSATPASTPTTTRTPHALAVKTPAPKTPSPSRTPASRARLGKTPAPPRFSATPPPPKQPKRAYSPHAAHLLPTPRRTPLAVEE